MIIRLVQLDIIPSKIDDFVQIFEHAKPSILKSAGCYEVRLIQDADDPSKMGTLSRWESIDSLNAYRDTDFFKETWAASKRLFQGRAVATSYTLVE